MSRGGKIGDKAIDTVQVGNFYLNLARSFCLFYAGGEAL
jgi:hypothetical protein